MKNGRPLLRVISSTRRTVTLSKEDVEGLDIEAAVMREEARAHVRRMRLSLQRSFWSEWPFTAVKRSLLDEIEIYARKVDDTPERAA